MTHGSWALLCCVGVGVGVAGEDSSARLARLRRAAITKYHSSSRPAADPGGLSSAPSPSLSPSRSPSPSRAASARRRRPWSSALQPQPHPQPAESPEAASTRLAVDALLLAQLDSAVLPESFIRKSGVRTLRYLYHQGLSICSLDLT